jgi:hypothetical protein
VVDKVLTDGVMPVHGFRYFKLGSDPVDAGYQHRLLITFDFEHAAEKPRTCQYFRSCGLFGMLFDYRFYTVSGIDADTCRIISVLYLICLLKLFLKQSFLPVAVGVC